MTDPIDLAKTLFAALDAEDWTGAARLFNPAQVEEWYREFLQRRPKEQDVLLTVDQYLKHSPDMPREVAEYQVAELRKRHRSRSPADDLAGVHTWEEAEDLAPVEGYARYLQHRDPREQLRRAESGRRASREELDEHQIAFRHAVLGGVEEKNTLVHVVYRRYWGGHDRSGSLHLVTCSRNDAGWTVEVSFEWEVALSSYSYTSESYEEEDCADPKSGRTAYD